MRASFRLKERENYPLRQRAGMAPDALSAPPARVGSRTSTRSSQRVRPHHVPYEGDGSELCRLFIAQRDDLVESLRPEPNRVHIECVTVDARRGNAERDACVATWVVIDVREDLVAKLPELI